MRRLLNHNPWLTTSVIALLLLATSSLSISRMTCLISGHSLLSVGIPEGCCPEDEHPVEASIAATCCVFDQASSTAEPFLPAELSGAVVLFAVQALAPAIHLFHIEQLALRPSTARPPPLQLAERLATFATYRI